MTADPHPGLVDKPRIEAAVRELLSAIGEDPGREGLRDLACAFAVLESSVARRTVDVDEVLRGELREYQRPIDERFDLL